MPMVTFIAVRPDASARSSHGLPSSAGGGTCALGRSAAEPMPSMMIGSTYRLLSRPAARVSPSNRVTRTARIGAGRPHAGRHIVLDDTHGAGAPVIVAPVPHIVPARFQRVDRGA